MSHISVDLLNLYKTYFGGNFEIDTRFYNRNNDANDATKFGIRVAEELSGSGHEGRYGKYIFLPVELWESDSLSIKFKCATLKMSSKKTIIKTPVARRIGTVKEQYAVGDYVFTINGVLINPRRSYPDDQIETLKYLYESESRIEIRNAFAEIFLTNLSTQLEKDRCPVVIESLEFPEKKGGDIWHVPFSLVCETDFAETLIFSEDSLKNNRYYVSP